jgi:outer membrane immunogenic protein
VRGILAVAAAGVILFPACVSAADFPVFPVKAVTPGIAVYEWSGFYVGGAAGYGWGSEQVGHRLDLVSGTISPPYSVPPHGWLGGLQAGYNWMPTPQFLVGVEADLSATNISEPHILPNTPPTFVADVKNKVGWLGTARGRAGWNFGSFLVYGTGGLAWLNLDHNRLQVLGTSNNAVPGSLDTMAVWAAGWTAGAGVEFGLTPHWSIKTEYLYFTSFQPIAVTNALAESTNTFRINDSIARAGLNYRF